MTGTKSTRERFGAIFFAAIMVTSMVAFGMAGFAGNAAADVSNPAGNAAGVTQGANGQAVGTVSLTESDFSSDFGSSGTATISPADQSVTINQSETDLTFSTSSGSVSDLRLENGQIKFSYTGLNTSTSADPVIGIGGIAVDVGVNANSADFDATVGTGTNTESIPVETLSASASVVGVSPGASSSSTTLTVTDAETDDGTPDGTIKNGTTVTISIPDNAPGLTFNQSVPIGLSDSNGQMVTSNAQFVDDQTIAVDVDESDGALSANDEFQIDVGFNATRDAAAASGLKLDLISTPPNPNGEVTVQSASVVNVNSPSVELNGDQNASIGNDADGEVGVSLPNKNEFNITSGGNDDIADSSGKNVTITIPESAAFSFDQSSASLSATHRGNITAATPVLVDSRNINVTLIGGAKNSNDNATVSGFNINTTAGEASSSQLQFAVNESGPTGSSTNFITVTQATGDTIEGDGDISASPGLQADPSVVSGQVGSTLTGQVRLTNTSGVSLGNLGGEEITLSVTDSPTGSSPSLNTTSITTRQDGTAEFNITLGNAGGNYNVTAVNADNPDVNITLEYRTSAGPITQFNVTGQENALIDTTDLSTTPDQATSQGVYQVRLEDTNGNLNSTATDGTEVNFRLSLGDNDAGIQNVTTALSNTGTATGNATSESSGVYTYNYTKDTDGPGVFYVFVNDPTPGDTDLTVQEGGTSDTGTTTFFDTVDSVAVSFNTTNVATGDTVEVTAEPQTSDETTIAVGGISVEFNSTNTSVASSADGSFTLSDSTDANGAAVTNLSIDGNGTADITATADGVEGSSTISVDGTAPAESIEDYRNDEGNVEIEGLRSGIDDFTNGDIDIELLRQIIDEFTQ